MPLRARMTPAPAALWFRKFLGGTLIVVGALALALPVVPGALLLFVGLSLLGVRIGFWVRAREWWRAVASRLRSRP